MERVAIGLLGLGTVGGGVARLLAEGGNRLARRCGKQLELKWALVRDPSRLRDCPVPPDRIVTDPDRIINDPEIPVVIEAIGGIEPAKSLVLAALRSGKHVVTANKALLADHGPELFTTARRHRRAIAFEASVGGGIPVIQALSVALAANEIQGLSAILNGTCNFILTSMADGGTPYAEALRQAQALGYAEADPILDVDGTDTAHKLAILAQVGFHATVTTRDIPRQGIDTLDLADIKYAAELGYAVKLIARASCTKAGLALRVGPTLVRHGSPIAEVRGPYNAIRIVGDAVGDALLYGRGAGAMPTASAVVGDLLDVVTGRAELTARVSPYWSEPFEGTTLAQPEHVVSRFYLRFTIPDRPGMLGKLAQVLGGRGISIASVIQHESGVPSENEAAPQGSGAEHPGPASEGVPLVIMTHEASEGDVGAALGEIDRLNPGLPKSIRLGVLD